MAQIPYRANLSAATFPVNISKFGRSVILPGLDQNFDRRVDARGDNSKDPGIPQVIYMENVLPTAEGYQSLGFFPPIESIPDVGGEIINALTRIPVKNFVSPFFGFFYWIAFYSGGEVRALVADPQLPAYEQSWSVVTLPIGFLQPTDDTHVFWAHCQGRTFVLITHDDIPSDSVLFEVTLIGATVTFTDVTPATTGTPLPGGWRSIAGCYNYLILNTSDTVYWSSLTDPLDFTASLVTGAGFESVGASVTRMNFLVSAAIGFYVFTFSNVVVAQYTGNKAYPWRFIPVEGSGVAITNTDVVSSIEADDVFLHTSRGQLQQIEGRNAVQVLSEVTDYLERAVESDSFDWSTNTFTVSRAENLAPGNKQFTKVWFVCERYLIISYNQRDGLSGIEAYNEAFVFDIMLRRMGKLIIPGGHTHFLDDGIGFSAINIADGAPYGFYRVSQDIYEVEEGEGDDFLHDSVIIFGNFKTRRNTIIHLEEITVEATVDLTIPPALLNFETKALFTVNDVNYNSLAITPFLSNETFSSKKYNLRGAGSSFRLAFKGQFRMSCIAMKFHEVGHEL